MVFILYVLALPMSTIDCESLRVIGTVSHEKIIIFEARGRWDIKTPSCTKRPKSMIFINFEF